MKDVACAVTTLRDVKFKRLYIERLRAKLSIFKDVQDVKFKC